MHAWVHSSDPTCPDGMMGKFSKLEEAEDEYQMAENEIVVKDHVRM